MEEVDEERIKKKKYTEYRKEKREKRKKEERMKGYLIRLFPMSSST